MGRRCRRRAFFFLISRCCFVAFLDGLACRNGCPDGVGGCCILYYFLCAGLAAHLSDTNINLAVYRDVTVPGWSEEDL